MLEVGPGCHDMPAIRTRLSCPIGRSGHLRRTTAAQGEPVPFTTRGCGCQALKVALVENCLGRLGAQDGVQAFLNTPRHVVYTGTLGELLLLKGVQAPLMRNLRHFYCLFSVRAVVARRGR